MRILKMYQVVLFFAIVATVQTQFVSPGPCNFSMSIHQEELTSNNTVYENFYEIRRIDNSWNTGQCSSWHMTSSNGSLSITMKEVVKRNVIERNSTVSLNDTLNNDSINIVFRDFTSNFTFIGLANEFVVLYACSDQGENKQEYAWVLGLNTTLSESAKNTTETIMRNNNLSNATWVESSHTEDSCRSGATTNFKVSSIIVLIVGFVVSKGL